ncbi:hypothetical protein [Desulfopila inferna]|uniref:hypothetical protein n=1 Tax=Desulfopila inferna TaxID=468528 RepID=UPI0019661EDA|nr:hypothetical protein [Desulfopila inferna]MBM9603336.1 hypothetical protein [Desulfopila inferna]
MKGFLVLITILPLLFLSGCSREGVGGAAIGAGAAGAAYEYQNKRAMDNLEEDLAAGRITQEEYERRKDEIESKSIVY